MTRRMLINGQNPEELRVAIISDSTLEDYQVEVAERGLTRGNIYRGIITVVQPSLNAVFVDYGADRHGFLAIQDVVAQAYHKEPAGDGRPRIEDVLERGRSILVQVTKEPEGQKGAAMTTNLSLAGRYLVLMPFDATLGVSRRVEDEETRRKLRDHATKLELPEGFGIIVRTNALDQTKTTLQSDLAALLRVWKKIDAAAREGHTIQLLYSDQDLVLQALRDHLDQSIDELLIDDDKAFAKAEMYMDAFMPRSKTVVTRYTDRTPLFARHNLDAQIDRIYERRVDLPGGGYLVIDPTEALTSIDVNSGKGTRAASQEETALNTNVEAAGEIPRQLRLRNIGGLVVIDFIDMRSQRGRRQVEKAIRDGMKGDRARVTVSRISANGLVEINRQRLQQALHLRTHRSCPTCSGTGRIASPELVGLRLLRLIEAKAATGTLRRARIALHPELADAFQNARRHEISSLEDEFDIKVEVIAASQLHRPDQQIEWFQREGVEARPSAAVDAPRPSPRPLPERMAPRPRPLPERPSPRPRPLPATPAPAPRVAAEGEAEGPQGEAARRGRRRRRGRGGRRGEGGELGGELISTTSAEAPEERSSYIVEATVSGAFGEVFRSVPTEAPLREAALPRPEVNAESPPEVDASLDPDLEPPDDLDEADAADGAAATAVSGEGGAPERPRRHHRRRRRGGRTNRAPTPTTT